MDQNKNTRGQQGQGQQNMGQQKPQDQGQQQGSQSGSQSNPNWNTPSQPTRDQAEGSRDKTRSNMGSQERGTGSQAEKNRSGISNRGTGSSDEQSDLPSRGSSDDDSMDQSER